MMAAALRQRIHFAKIILGKWLEAGLLRSQDIGRVLDGTYHYFVSFRVGNPLIGTTEGFLVVTGAESHREAVEAADLYLGVGNYASVTHELRFDPRRYPEGEVGRFSTSPEEGWELALSCENA